MPDRKFPSPALPPVPTVPVVPAAAKTEPPRPPVDLNEEGGAFLLIDALLKSPASLWDHLRGARAKAPLLLGAVLICNVALFGLVIGSFSGGVQWWAAPLKITGGLLVAGTICFPSLYIFTCLSGADLRPGHLARGFVAALALVTLVLIGFAPIVWIFSQSTDSLGFMGRSFCSSGCWDASSGSVF